MFNHIESYMKAAEVALKMKNEDALDEIFRRTDDQDVRDFIENGVRR